MKIYYDLWFKTSMKTRFDGAEKRFQKNWSWFVFSICWDFDKFTENKKIEEIFLLLNLKISNCIKF